MSAKATIGQRAAALAQSPALSVVLPMCNEAAHVDELHRRLTVALDPLDIDYEIVAVDDGSRDATFDVLTALHARDARVRALRLSRNFGKEIAITAGLDASRGDYVALLDADLQHPPEALPEMIERARGGYDVVYAVRRGREGQGIVRRIASNAFHALLRRIADIDVIDGAGDFRVMARPVVDALCKLRESHRYMKGLYAWAGFRTTHVRFDQTARAGGRSRWSLWTLMRLALDALTSFSTFPLRLVTIFGLAIAALSLAGAVYCGVRAGLHGEPIDGSTWLLVGAIFLGSVQLIALGVIGEYVGRAYLESKRRPLYFVRQSIGLDHEDEARCAR